MVKIIKPEIKDLDPKQEEKSEQKEHKTSTQTLKNFLDSLQIERGIAYKKLVVFPIQVTTKSEVKLKTLDEALKEQILEIRETSVVGELKFVNKSKTDKILIVEGDVVKGGKQNRVINVTMILDEDSSTIVPTSCVEQSRWSGSTMKFDEHIKISPTLHTNLSKTVGETMFESYQGGRGMCCYASNQSNLWGEISSYNIAIGTNSPTQDFTSSYETREEDIKEYLDKILPEISDCCGLVALIADKIYVSIADSKELFMLQLEKLLKSYILDALVAKARSEITLEQIVDVLEKLAENEFNEFPSPNKIGNILKFKEPYIGSALIYKDALVHLTFAK